MQINLCLSCLNFSEPLKAINTTVYFDHIHVNVEQNVFDEM